MNTPTPRTNRAWNILGDDNAEAAWSFARTLERELATERAQLKEMAAELAHCAGYIASVRTDRQITWHEELYALQTVEWAEGAVEIAEKANAVLEAHDAAMKEDREMSTPTEVHLDLALQIAEALARSGNVAAAELIAASEARATAELRDSLAIGQDNCNDAYDELATDCAELRGDVVRLTAERDQLRAENATLRAAQKACEACDEPTAFEVRQLRAELAAERARSPGPRLAPESPTEMRPN